jgi:hypothetical protein
MVVEDHLYKLDPVGVHRVPDENTREAHLNAMHAASTHMDASILGLHVNADYIRDTRESLDVLKWAAIMS